MRKLLTVTLVLALVLGLSGLALATENFVFVDQASPNDFLDLDQFGYDNNVRLVQVAHDANDARINQSGYNNWLCRAYPSGTVDYTGNAYQNSTRTHNDLTLMVIGNNNTAGLRQIGWLDNVADITQTSNGNYLAAYQENVNGNNLLDVTQSGNDHAEIYQYASTGQNNVTVFQH